MTLQNKLSQFIQEHWDGQSPLLLALSGGPDSLVLLQLLVKMKENLHFKLAVAHVDHRWRPSSEDEAKILEEYSCKLDIPFHLKTLAPEILTGNLEAACRMARLDFFRELCSEHSYQAVFLGHHADDQAETVLKRIFEGVSLPYLAALRSVTCMDKLTLWRPLLNSSKKELLEELKCCELEVEPVDDETNKDPKFLRARFRTKLLPMLSKEFGKEINVHLNNLSYEAQELNIYLDEKTSDFYSKKIESSFGWMLEFKENISLAPLELKHLIRRFCRDVGIALSKEGLERTIYFLTTGAANKMISCGKETLYIDRHCLFALKMLNQNGNDCEMTIENSTLISEEKNKGWRDVWEGKIKVTLPSSSSPYTLAYPKLGDCYPNSSPIGHWWNKNKVPVFMRSLLPVVYCEGEIVHEFLSGRKSEVCIKESLIIAITLERKM